MGFTRFPQVFCLFFGFLCDFGHKRGDFTGDLVGTVRNQTQLCE